MRLVRCAMVFVAVATAGALAPTMAHASDELSVEPALDRGVAQLEGVQLPDGGFGGRLAVRDAAAAGEALRLARPRSAAIPRIAGFLSAQALGDVDSLARAALGSPLSRYAGTLLAEQNDDGGFGLSREYQSDVLDTALALRALSALGERDAARRAVDRLLKFSTAGAWGAEVGEVALTAEALLALGEYIRRYGSTTAINIALAGGFAWLGDVQQADGGWSPGALSVRDTALALVALAPSPAAVSRVSEGANAIVRAQLPDGSWGNTFSTALALRALHGAAAAIERDRVTLLADPSLSAGEISADPQSVETGKAVTIKVSVHNAGMAPALGVTAEFFLDDPASGSEPVASSRVPDLAPGARAEVDTTFAVDRPRGRARAHVVLRVPVGEDRDLANNSIFINLFVRTARNTYNRTADWPRAGRDMQHSGTTPNRLLPALDADPIWRAPADGAHIVAEGKVYFGEDGRITARDAKTGELDWQRGASYLDDRYRPPIYNRGFIFTASEGQTGALNAKTGEPAPYGAGGWDGDRPVFAVEVIPVEGAHDPVFMYMAQHPWINTGNGHCHIEPYKDPSGSPWNVASWRGESLVFPLPCDGEPLAFSSDDSRAFFVSGNSMNSFDPATAQGPNGEAVTALFSTKLPGVVRAPTAPLVDSLNQVVVAGWEGSVVPSPNPSIPSFTQTGNGRVVAADPATGIAYWAVTTDTRLDGSPVEYKGTLIVIDRSGRVYGLDQITGALKWSWKPDGYVPPAVDEQGKSAQTLALSGRYLYVPHPDGRLYTLDARNGTALSSTSFSARPYDLAIDDTNNAIYVRTLDGYVGAYRTHKLPDQCAPDPLDAPAAPGPIDRVSMTPDGSQLAAPGVADERPAISADGRVVAFTRDYGPPSYNTELYIRDLETGVTTALPITTQDGDVTRSNPHLPTLSADGRYLGYVARQRNERTGEHADMMFVLDRETGISEYVLKKPDGSPEYDIGVNATSARASYWWEKPGMSMSGDGQTVAFASATNGIVPEDNDNTMDVFVVSRYSGKRTLVSRASAGRPATDDNRSPSLSRDGRYVAFTSTGSLTDAVIETGPNDSGAPYVHLYDIATDDVIPVSVTDTGTVVNGNMPHVSGDGRFVTFTSGAPLLYPPPLRETDPWWVRSVDAFVWDRATRRVDFASMNDSGEHARYAQINKPVVSDDGQYVAFESTGIFVKGVSLWQQAQIIARDRAAGSTRQISHNAWNVSGSGESLAPVVSADGNRVAFLSSAPDLDDGDTNNARDVFVYDRSRAATHEQPVDPRETGGGSCPVDGDESYSDLSLRAEDIQPSALEQGQPGRVAVTVHNAGGATSEATTARLYDRDGTQDTPIGERSLAELAAGASTTLEFIWDPVAAAGAHTLTVVLDPDRLVFEQDLANNKAEKAVEVAAPRLELSVNTDKPAYGAQQPVEVAAHIANRSVAERDLRLVMSIRDADSDPVATVHDTQVAVEPNGDAAINGDWNTRDTTPGRYTVSARLLNAVGDELAIASLPFEIEPHVAAGLALETDQVSYASTETAEIGALVSNRSANGALTGARVELSLSNPHGVLLDRWDLRADDVMPGRSALLKQDKPLHGLEPGNYHVSARLLAADDTQLADAGAQFALGSSADSGDGVRGSLKATPTNPERHSMVTFDYSLTNSGNVDIPGATVRVRISDLDSGQTLKTLDDAARTISRAEATTGRLSAAADVVEDRDYQASLHLVLADGSERPLDRTIFHVRSAPSSSPPPPAPLPMPASPPFAAPPALSPVRPPPPRPSGSDLILACTNRRVVLEDVVPVRGRVALVGVAARTFAGSRVTIMFTATRKTVARPVVGSDGRFSATAPLPPRAIRSTNAARYQARIGSERSPALKLVRRIQVTTLRASDGRVTIAGRVVKPLARRKVDRAITLMRQVTCEHSEPIARVMPRADGRFSVTVAAPPGERAAVYRLQTDIRRTPTSRRHFETFTLPRAVDF